jgi:hypothetical protein
VPGAGCSASSSAAGGDCLLVHSLGTALDDVVVADVLVVVVGVAAAALPVAVTKAVTRQVTTMSRAAAGRRAGRDTLAG